MICKIRTNLDIFLRLASEVEYDLNSANCLHCSQTASYMGENVHQWKERVSDLIREMGEHLATCSTCKKGLGSTLVGGLGVEMSGHRRDPTSEVNPPQSADLLIA